MGAIRYRAGPARNAESLRGSGAREGSSGPQEGVGETSEAVSRRRFGLVSGGETRRRMLRALTRLLRPHLTILERHRRSGLPGRPAEGIERLRREHDAIDD